ncbi:DUF2332 domain-containing protein [Blastococcus brunescens]|uniref:DUF2332 domain-containing protein n=1 Tax=Blastococcus brunescens TaxID=1564165 RepID=A0ABZ1AX89_9ACTN|nr:DUF2332 domain-containing protein [Blastococcus sp. BMG 8361]WRL62526.1 DUF2332 domain-containing protein [Blastococcus sp. BMG 8361]
MTDDDRTRTVRQYRRFAEVEAVDTSPLYAELAAAVAGDEELLDFLLALPAPKRQPNLLFAAVTFLHGTPRGPAELRGRVRDDGERVRATMLARFTQTNEPGRCAALVTALGAVEGPVGLIEVGSAAGLCLYPDRYSYDFDGRFVGRRSAVHLTCSTTGPVPVPDDVPEVVARVGVDRNPLDPADAGDQAWLRALIWPGPSEGARLDRLAAAAELAAQEPPTVLRGDLVDRLPEALALLPAGCTPVVFHTAVLMYLERARREEFVALVRSLEVRWIAQEMPGVLPGAAGSVGAPGRFVLALDGRPLAVTAPHGGRIDWLTGG